MIPHLPRIHPFLSRSLFLFILPTIPFQIHSKSESESASQHAARLSLSPSLIYCPTNFPTPLNSPPPISPSAAIFPFSCACDYRFQPYHSYHIKPSFRTELLKSTRGPCCVVILITQPYPITPHHPQHNERPNTSTKGGTCCRGKRERGVSKWQWHRVNAL